MHLQLSSSLAEPKLFSISRVTKLLATVCQTAILEQERGVMPTPLASQTWQNLVITETATPLYWILKQSNLKIN